ncbi:MAG: methyltransferase domain-containing protein [Chloroflexi bacterium]|nr:methyltransferase domain-containing protein [Chloroflexota bacterium]MCL5076074.1 methyltransferase domain-containing protein [Chloroflexota bacterium]
MSQDRTNAIDTKLTARVKARYDRIAPFYDLLSSWLEGASAWYERLWAEVSGSRILEIGVGTGKNFPYYPAGAEVTAIDLSPAMLARAKERVQREGRTVDLRLMDAQCLEFPDDTFDSVVTSFVFCSVPDPILGLREAGRVCKPEGRLVLLEHVRSETILGPFMDLLNPLVVFLHGANINRRTVDNVRRAGLRIQRVDNLALDIVNLIIAQP